MSYYWELTQFDGTVTEIPPDKVEVVRRKWRNNEPIQTSVMDIPANQIKSFRQTSKPYNTQPVLEAAAQAFNEPMFNPDGSMVARWVKKPVTQVEYRKNYAIPAYHNIGMEGSMVMVAYRLPVHEIDMSVLTDCTPDEVAKLTRT